MFNGFCFYLGFLSLFLFYFFGFVLLFCFFLVFKLQLVFIKVKKKDYEINDVKLIQADF